MSPPSTDFIHCKRVGLPTLGVRWHILQGLPVTLAVVLGPFIAIAYHLTQRVTAKPGSFSIAQASRGLLCVLMLLSLFLSGGGHLLRHRLVRPLLFLAGYAALTSFAAPYPYQNVVFAVKMLFIILVFVSALRLAEEGLVSGRWLTICAWIVLLTMVTCISIGVITARTFDVYETRYATAGLTNHPSTASEFTLSTLPVFIQCVAVGRSALFGMTLLYASLFFTMRRSAIIAAVAATGCSLLISLTPFRASIPWRRALVILGVLLLSTGIGLNTPAGADLMARFRDLDPREGNGSGRYIFWRISLEHIFDRPLQAQLWGEGVGHIRDVLGKQYGLAIPSHNDGLDLVNAFGLCGLIGMGWWYLELTHFVRCFHRQRNGLFQGVCTCVIILSLISIGTGGAFEPPWALSYAAMGFWAGRAASVQ